MTQDELRQTVRTLAGALAPTPQGPAAPDSDMIDDLQYDSVSLMELIVALEQEFELPPLDDDGFLDVRTVGEVEELISTLVSKVAR